MLGNVQHLFLEGVLKPVAVVVTRACLSRD